MKRVPLMTQPIQSPRRIIQDKPKSLSKGKQKQNKKIKQEQRKSSPLRSRHKNQLSFSPAKTQVKRQLFAIPQFQDSSTLVTGTKSQVSTSFVQTKNQQKPSRQRKIQQEDRSQSFQRSSIKMSQKVYNVSLASAKSKQKSDRLSRSPSVLSKAKKQNSKSRLSQSKKDKSKNPFNNIEDLEEAKKWLENTLKKVKNESIKKINEEFIKIVEQPLKIQSEISRSGSQVQRCLKHNTPFSLYCSIDRQLLCVGCIYSQKSHKSHRVLPLMKSQKEMREDIEAFKNRVQQTMSESEHLVRQASLNLIKMEKQCPALLNKIQKYYESIHEMIDKKKKEQLQYVQTLREEYNTELKVIGQFLNRINNIFMEKMRSISFQNRAIETEMKKMRIRQGDDQQCSEGPINQMSLQATIKTRCSFQTLSKYHKILHKHSDQLFDQRGRFDVRIQNFQQVLQLINYKLTLVTPTFNLKNTNLKGLSDLDIIDSAQLNQDEEKVKNQKNLKVHQKPLKEKNNEEKTPTHKKQFSTSPQVPKGLSRRFL